MTEMSDEEWSRKAEDMLEKIYDIIEDSDYEMVAELMACIMADMVDPMPVNDGMGLLFAFLSEVLEKAYGLESSVAHMGTMQ